MSVKLLTEHHLEFLSTKGGCTGSSESTLVKIPYCWKSHVTAHIFLQRHHINEIKTMVLLGFFVNVKVAPHEYVIRTGQTLDIGKS